MDATGQAAFYESIGMPGYEPPAMPQYLSPFASLESYDTFSPSFSGEEPHQGSSSIADGFRSALKWAGAFPVATSAVIGAVGGFVSIKGLTRLVGQSGTLFSPIITGIGMGLAALAGAVYLPSLLVGTTPKPGAQVPKTPQPPH